MNSDNRKRIFPGIDVLKFILAILIVAGHCLLFEEHSVISVFQNRLNSVAVPIFFAISAYLFFRKIISIPTVSETKSVLLHTVKRLLILFVCWYVLMLPMTWFKFYSVATLKEILFAIAFSCTFNGYWFIKGLLINTIIVYLCRRKRALIICSLLALFVHFYCSYNYIFVYNSQLLELHPYYSFYYHTIYFCVGALLARYQNLLFFERWPAKGLAFVWICLYLLCYFDVVDPLFRLFSILLIFPVFYRMKGGNSSLCKDLRNMSIILYMVQFVLIWLYDMGCKTWLDESSVAFSILQYSVTRFVVVLSLASVIALLIIKNEHRPHWSILKYLH